MDDAYDTFEFKHEGRDFLASLYYDDRLSPPWKEHDGHGPVRTVNAYYGHPEKRPGERVMHYDHGTYWLYDWQDACKRARKEGWNAAPYDAPNRIERAVQADFEFIKGWISSEWHWCGVEVKIIGADGEPEGEDFDHALWGIESNADDYHREVAKELADAILRQRGEAWLASLAEARQVKYWAARDVRTVPTLSRF